MPGTGKVLPKFMKTACQHAVGSIKCFLYAISVVAIDVDIEDAWIDAKKFQNCENDVVDVAEAGCLAFFGMMQATSPVNSNVAGTR